VFLKKKKKKTNSFVAKHLQNILEVQPKKSMSLKEGGNRL
jgi:hypothetical protein